MLKDFTYTFKAGKTTALVGPSGSGKSTIIQLVERFYDCNSGEVLIDGKNIKNINVRDYRRCVGYVAQEPILFNTTIKQNMLYSKPDATDAEIIEALKQANAWTFIEKKMTNGLETVVGGTDGKLSGG